MEIQNSESSEQKDYFPYLDRSYDKFNPNHSYSSQGVQQQYLPPPLPHTCLCNIIGTICQKQKCQCYNSLICTSQCCQNCRNSNKHKSSYLMKDDDYDIKSMEQQKKKKGCSCSTTRCQKKYCSCFANIKYCGKHCCCINCNNLESSDSDSGQFDKNQFNFIPFTYDD